MHVVDNLRALRPTRHIMADVHRHKLPRAREPVFQVTRGEARYPAGLLALSDVPPVLWVRGRCLPHDGLRAVAMVGARAASGAGCARARALAADLASLGLVIISGGAFGLDAAAHEGALAAGAATFAVLGCGVDVTYPDRHGPLFARIAARGGLLSEYPLGTPPRAGQFPARNRIIAALADAVIVVEAAHRSGALITASLGRSLGKPLLALGGSAGTDGLLRRGQAWPVASANDVEHVLAGHRPAPAAEVEPPAGPIAALVANLREGAATAASLSRRIGLPLPAVMAALAEAELEGWLCRSPGNQYEVIRRGC
jgi:DNA processing protein